MKNHQPSTIRFMYGSLHGVLNDEYCMHIIKMPINISFKQQSTVIFIEKSTSSVSSKLCVLTILIFETETIDETSWFHTIPINQPTTIHYPLSTTSIEWKIYVYIARRTSHIQSFQILIYIDDTYPCNISVRK